jgi:general secretion pathway protein L
MADWLLLRMPRTADEAAQWLVADTQGMALGSVLTGTLSEAATFAKGRRVCALVDATLVLTADLELPVKGGARALQVAPFALEEQLVGDLEQQHFAVGRRDDTSGRTQVAVVAKEQMQSWIAALGAAGITAELICADNALLFADAGQVIALLDEHSLSVAVASAGNVARCLPADDIGGALELALGSSDLAAVDLQLLVTPETWRARGQQVEALRTRLASLTVRTLNAGLLPWQAMQLAGGTPLNLLQGDYQVTRSQRQHWHRWRLAAGLALGLLVLHTAGRGYALWQVQRAQSEADSALTTMAAQLLPGTSVAPDAVRRTVQQRLSGASGVSPLMTTLQSLATTMDTGSGTRLEALSFRDGATELKVLARGAPQAEAFNQSLRSSGLNAELTAGNTVATGYDARIQIKSAGGNP